MKQQLNFYCDESHHLQFDNEDIMTLGAIVCSREEKDEITEKIKKIKIDHGVHSLQELKWTKISPSNLAIYEDIIKLFFEENLIFRGLVAHGKKSLNHDWFNQTHDEWYYKIYFRLLDSQLDSTLFNYKIYLDIKDTNSAEKVKKLNNILVNSHYKKINVDIQVIRSHESQFIQLTDIFIGALSYVAKKSKGSQAKLSIISLIEQLSNKNLSITTAKNEPKFNILHWSPVVMFE